jgi:hypothetical protein
MYFCATDFASFCEFSIGYKNYSYSVIFFGFNFINRTSNIWHTITKTFDVKMKLSSYNFIDLTFSSSSKYTILVHCRSIWVICVWGLETREKARLREPFPAFRAEYTYLPIFFDSAHVLYLSCNFKS